MAATRRASSGTPSGSARCRAREALEDLAPPPAHLLAESLGGRAEAFEVAMLEIHLRPLRSEGGERHLHLGYETGVVPELGVELPRQDEASGRVPGQHLAPVTLTAVFAEFVPAPVHPRLDHAVLERRLADVVLLRPPQPHVFREDAIRPLGRSFHDQLLSNRDHESVSFSVAALNAASARSQKRSRYFRMASMPRMSIR